MEFLVKTQDMQRAIKLLSVVAKVNTASFEGRVLISTETDKVKFLVNNGKTGMVHTIPAKVIDEGEVSVVYGKIRVFIMTFLPWDGTVGAEEFVFKSDGTKLSINASSLHLNGAVAKSELKVDLIETESIPRISSIESPNMILNSSIIKTAVDKVLYAVSTKDSIVAYTMCICMIFSDEFIKFVATNGRVLCEYKVKNDCSIKGGAYLLTHEFITGLRRIITDDVQLFWHVSANVAKIDFDNTLFQGYIQQIDLKDQYPDYEQKFSLFETVISVDRDVLLSGLQSFVDILNGDDFHRVSFIIENNKLILNTDVSHFELFDESFPADLQMAIDVSGKDMLNTLHSISDSNIKLKFIDKDNGLVFESAGYDLQQAYVVNLVRR